VNKRIAHLAFAAIILVFSIGLVYLGLFQRISAQDEARTFHDLLMEVSQRMEEDDTFIVAIRLHTAIVPGEDVLIVPDTDATDKITRIISSIGEDYVCFDVIGGSARFTECIPLSNIASIRWLE
jgi:hypothetical protein